MRVLHIVPYLPVASGVSVFVQRISDEMSKLGHSQCVAVNDMVRFDVAPSREIVPRITIKEAKSGILSACFDIVHIHGIWPYFIHGVVKAATKSNIPIVWSLHGMLAPWAMKYRRWKKIPAWLLWQKNDLKHASLLHATCNSEAMRARSLGFSMPIVQIPLGTDSHECPQWGARRNIVLFVGRLNPVKAIDNLINAWSKVTSAGSGKGWVLRIVGTDELGYGKVLKCLTHELGLDAAVVFVGPKYGVELANEYREAKVFVLPSHSENFGGVVVDAMSWGLPVIASRNTPWQVLDEAKCGRWVKNSPEDLFVAISEMITSEDGMLKAMGERGKMIVAARYVWRAVAEQMLRAYVVAVDSQNAKYGRKSD